MKIRMANQAERMPRARQPQRRGGVLVGVVVGTPLLVAVTGVSIGFLKAGSPLPPVPVPFENPITEEKRVLGKLLFWDEQLSTDNTTACGSCHIPTAAGIDPRAVRSSGLDGLLFTGDDILASPGVIRQDSDGHYVHDAVFGVLAQVTPRAASSMINTAYAEALFWDGRATSEFVDPESGQVSIASGGALESQAVDPPLDTIEMAHADRDWDQVRAKLAGAAPLALAVDPPADLAAVLASNPSYPELFASAFGDDAITAERIAFALATYQRTLISDQSPWDQFMAGDASALTPEQLDGWNRFQVNKCNACHVPPLFTDNLFHNIGIRPIAEDAGLASTTGDPADRGKFKTPGLRNSGLKPTFMHTGRFQTFESAIALYVTFPRFPENSDPLLNETNPSPADVGPLATFLGEALLDPRVAAEEFPFDRPTLRQELPANPALLGGGTAHPSLDVVPRIIAQTPPLIGSAEFKLGITGVNRNESVQLRVSTEPPVNGVLTSGSIVGSTTATRNGGTDPVATIFWPIPADAALDGAVYYFQFETGTGARTEVAQATLFCGLGGCGSACPADLNGDGILDLGDLNAFVAAFLAGDTAAEFNGDGILDLGDINAFVAAYLAECAQ